MDIKAVRRGIFIISIFILCISVSACGMSTKSKGNLYSEVTKKDSNLNETKNIVKENKTLTLAKISAEPCQLSIIQDESKYQLSPLLKENQQRLKPDIPLGYDIVGLHFINNITIFLQTAESVNRGKPERKFKYLIYFIDNGITTEFDDENNHFHPEEIKDNNIGKLEITTPDNSILSFSSNYKIIKKVEKPKSLKVEDLALSHDGGKIAFRSDNGLVVANSDYSDRQLFIDSNPATIGITSPTWTSDDKGLIIQKLGDYWIDGFAIANLDNNKVIYYETKSLGGWYPVEVFNDANYLLCSVDGANKGGVLDIKENRIIILPLEFDHAQIYYSPNLSKFISYEPKNTNTNEQTRYYLCDFLNKTKVELKSMENSKGIILGGWAPDSNSFVYSNGVEINLLNID